MGFGGVTPKKTALKGGHLKKITSRKILPLLEGGRGKKISYLGGGVMQHSNDTSKNSTSPPYLVKNERSPRPQCQSSCSVLTNVYSSGT